MASIGHEVVGIDAEERKIVALSEGEAPFRVPRLQEFVTAGIGVGDQRFTIDMAEAVGARVHFVGVGTPQQKDSCAADLMYVNAAFDALLPYLAPGDVVAGKSTVPIGAAARPVPRVSETGATLMWNPEFLREGYAVQSTVDPDRLVAGVPAGEEGEVAAFLLRQVYHPAIAKGTPFIVADYMTAELVTVSANALLATKITLINAMPEGTGADVTQLADTIGHDVRIGHRFLEVGIGFGGGCLPKDIRAFSARAEGLGRGESVAFLRQVDEVNLRRRDRAVQPVVEGLGGSVFEKKVTVLGAAFKPHSDDIRDSPALDVVVRLHGLGATVTVIDPAVIGTARRVHPQATYVEDRDEANRDGDAFVLLTEWNEYWRQLFPRAGVAAHRRSRRSGRPQRARRRRVSRRGLGISGDGTAVTTSGRTYTLAETTHITIERGETCAE